VTVTQQPPEAIPSGEDTGAAFLLQNPETAEDARIKSLQDFVKKFREQGLSYKRIADKFNLDGIPTISGRGRWAQSGIKRLVDAAQNFRDL
jgi:hypothetical protein